MSDNTELLTEIENIGISLLPSVVRIIVTELDKTADVEGAVTASEGIVTNVQALVTALRAKSTTTTAVAA